MFANLRKDIIKSVKAKKEIYDMAAVNHEKLMDIYTKDKELLRKVFLEIHVELATFPKIKVIDEKLSDDDGLYSFGLEFPVASGMASSLVLELKEDVNSYIGVDLRKRNRIQPYLYLTMSTRANLDTAIPAGLKTANYTYYAESIDLIQLRILQITRDVYSWVGRNEIAVDELLFASEKVGAEEVQAAQRNLIRDAVGNDSSSDK